MLRQRISPPCVCSWIGPCLGNASGGFLLPVVLQPGVIDDQLAVEIDGDPFADHEDAEAVPLAERLVGQDERITARGAGLVVPQVRRCPCRRRDSICRLPWYKSQICTCGVASQIDAAVGLGNGLVFDEQLDVAIILVGSQIGAVAVVDQLVLFDRPVLFRVSRPFGDLGRCARPRTWQPACRGRSLAACRASRTGPCH